MAKKAGRSAKEAHTGSSIAPVGFEAKLWAAAAALRNDMDAAEYKHVVFGLMDRMVALPGQLFYSTRIRACPDLLGKYGTAGKCRCVSELELAA